MRVPFEGEEACAWVRIPAHKNDITFDIATSIISTNDVFKLATALTNIDFTAARKSTFTNAPKDTDPKIFSASKVTSPPTTNNSFYRIEHFPMPDEIKLRITGMDFLPSGDLVVCTWDGEVYVIKKFRDDSGKARIPVLLEGSTTRSG